MEKSTLALSSSIRRLGKWFLIPVSDRPVSVRERKVFRDFDDDETKKNKRCADSMIDSSQLVGKPLCGDDVNLGSERACLLQLNSRPLGARSNCIM